MAIYLSRHSSPNRFDRALGLRGIGMVFKHVVPRPLVGADARPLAERVLDEMSETELRRFIEHQEWPAWAADRLRRAGFSLRCRSGDPDDAGADAHPSAGTGHGEFGDADQEDDAGRAADDPPPAQAPSTAGPPPAPKPSPTSPPPLAASRISGARIPSQAHMDHALLGPRSHATSLIPWS